MCDPCQQLYDGWLTMANALWRGQCWKCLTRGGLCNICKSNLDTHRQEQRALTIRQLDAIKAGCHHERNTR